MFRRTIHFHQLLTGLFERLKEKRVAPSYLDEKIALVLNNINDESRSGRYILKWLYKFAGEVNDASWLCDVIEVALPPVYAASHKHDVPDENEQHERLKIMLQMLGFAERYWIGMICGTSGVDARTKHWVHKKYLRYVVLPVVRQAHSFYESRDMLLFLSGLINPDALDLKAAMRWVKDMEAVRKEIAAKPQVRRQIARDRKRVRRQSLEIPEIPARELSLEERISLAPEISHDAMRQAQKDLGQLILSLKEIEPFIIQEITFLAESKGGQKAYRHILKVTDIAERFAVAYGLSLEQQYIIRIAGLVHDDGKFRTDVKDILVTSQKSKEDFNEWEREILKRHEELSLSLLEKVWLDVPFIVHILLYGPERYLALKPVIRQLTPFTWEDLITTQILFRLSDKFAALTESAEGRPYRPEEACLQPGGIRGWIEEEKGNFLWIPELDPEKIIVFFENELSTF